MKRAMAALLAFLSCEMAAAQDFGGLNLRPGQPVRVTDDTGSRVNGPVVSLTAEALRVGNQEFTPTRVTKIERRGDPLWNGVLIGAAVGVALSSIPNEACTDNTRLECIGLGIETGAIMGVIADWLHRGYTTVYRGAPRKSVALVPRIDRRARGAALLLQF